MLKTSLMTRRNSSERSRGFTLIELLLAMVVLTFGLLALWALHAASIQASGRAYRLGMATTLAQDAMEKLMSEAFLSNDPSGVNPDLAPMGIFPAVDPDGLDDLPGAVDGLGVQVNSLASTNTSFGPAMFLRTYHTQNVGAETDRLLIRVRVSYYDDSGKRHGVTLASTRLVDRYDPMGLGVSSI
ncbi:MAG: prepilin-type N-terminal cleavage/methylation domain-containing protein [Deltaproteobacteria bacterium]|nr:prepilin-type N-terminal cleavage/methylation domain-containing protein [Deltaproteobacteria bacterium]